MLREPTADTIRRTRSKDQFRMFGFLNCNKPIGFSSRDLVNVVQGRLRGRKIKVGHCGTLDPLADGVLVVGVGPAARLVPYVHETSKSYVGTFRLAAESPTGDLEVEPTVHEDHPVPTLDDIASACHRLTGVITQTPPAYSAIKIGGKRAYDMARQGRDVEVPSREVKIDSLEIDSYDYPNLKLRIVCGTGTYIRSLGMDLAKAVGTVAVMTALTRTAVGPFRLEDAVTLDQIRNQEIETMLLPAASGVDHLSKRFVDGEECRRLANGLCLDLSNPPSSGIDSGVTEHVAAIRDDGHLKAILVRKNNLWCPKRVFPD